MSEEKRQLSFESVAAMDNYSSSHDSVDESSPSESSPLASSPLSTPETFDLEEAPPLNVAGGYGGLGPHSTTPDPTFVLVIGGLGFIGSHTVLELLRSGFNGKDSTSADRQSARSGIPQTNVN